MQIITYGKTKKTRYTICMLIDIARGNAIMIKKTNPKYQLVLRRKAYAIQTKQIVSETNVAHKAAKLKLGNSNTHEKY